jgi:hypothetical protein
MSGFDGGTECVMLDLNAALLVPFDWTSQIGTESITQPVSTVNGFIVLGAPAKLVGKSKVI